MIGSRTGEQPPAGMPGQSEDRPARSGERPHESAPLGVPEPDSLVIPSTGEGAPIRGKDNSMDFSGMRSRPEQGTLLHIPYVGRSIPTPGGQCMPIWTECDGEDLVRMGLPGAVEGLASFQPYPQFSQLVPRSPVPPIGACGDCCDVI